MVLPDRRARALTDVIARMYVGLDLARAVLAHEPWGQVPICHMNFSSSHRNEQSRALSRLRMLPLTSERKHRVDLKRTLPGGPVR